MWTILALKVAARPYYDALRKLDPKWLDRAKQLEQAQAIGTLMLPPNVPDISTVPTIIKIKNR